MDIAKAMYLGGKIIYARDKSLDYNSYRELGLRCYVCGEPVHFRKGEERKPHFAHFPGVDPKQVEVCRLRVASYGTDTENGEYRLIEDREQRLKIFQSHFIEIIANTIPDFYQVVQAAKQSADLSSFAAVIPDIIRYFVNNRKSIVEQYCQVYQDKLKHITALQKAIGLEAIDFLGIKSSHYLLEKMLWYICSLNKSKQLTVNKRYAELLLFIIDIVINTPWIEAYRSIFTLQASLFQTTTKEQNQQRTTGLKVVESNKKSDVKLERLSGGLIDSYSKPFQATDKRWYQLEIGSGSVVKLHYLPDGVGSDKVSMGAIGTVETIQSEVSKWKNLTFDKEDETKLSRKLADWLNKQLEAPTVKAILDKFPLLASVKISEDVISAIVPTELHNLLPRQIILTKKSQPVATSIYRPSTHDQLSLLPLPVELVNEITERVREWVSKLKVSDFNANFLLGASTFGRNTQSNSK